MSFTTITGRAFNQAVSEAKKAANLGPVFITDRGRPAHVLMSMATYQRLTGQASKIADLLYMQGTEDFEFDTPRSTELARAADLS